MQNADEVLRQLDALVVEIVGRPIDPDANYFTAGLDSLAVTKLHTLLTRRLDVTLPVMALFRRPTLRATATAVVARRAADAAASPAGTHVGDQADGRTSAGAAGEPGPGTRRPGGAAASRREIRERIRRDGTTR